MITSTECSAFSDQLTQENVHKVAQAHRNPTADRTADSAILEIWCFIYVYMHMDRANREVQWVNSNTVTDKRYSNSTHSVYYMGNKLVTIALLLGRQGALYYHHHLSILSYDTINFNNYTGYQCAVQTYSGRSFISESVESDGNTSIK